MRRKRPSTIFASDEAPSALAALRSRIWRVSGTREDGSRGDDEMPTASPGDGRLLDVVGFAMTIVVVVIVVALAIDDGAILGFVIAAIAVAGLAIAAVTFTPGAPVRVPNRHQRRAFRVVAAVITVLAVGIALLLDLGWEVGVTCAGLVTGSVVQPLLARRWELPEDADPDEDDTPTVRRLRSLVWSISGTAPRADARHDAR